jgi:zinc protease
LPKITPTPAKVVLINRSDLTQAEVRMGFLAPSIHAPEHYALGVANALFGEYFNSRLNSLIRDKLGLTYSIASSFAYEKDYASFAIGCATRNETGGELVEKTIGVLKGLKKGPITPEEVTTAKDYLVGGFPLSTSTLGAVAARWLSGYVFDRGPNYLNEFVPQVEGVTQEEVEKAVTKDFDIDHLLIVIAGDAKQVEKSLHEAGIRSIQKIDMKDLM